MRAILPGLLAFTVFTAIASAAPGPLDPRGRAHIAIGIPNTVDTLKTFVEPEGPFSPGVATYGVYFWLWDGQKLVAPTMGVDVQYGLAEGGYLIPWMKYAADGVEVRQEICHVLRPSPKGEVHVVAARVTLTNRRAEAAKVALYAAVRGLGPAGGMIRSISVSEDRRVVMVDGRTALVCDARAEGGALADDSAGAMATAGRIPEAREAASATGDASALLRLSVELQANEAKTVAFICPVLPGRRAVGHQWDGKNPWAQLDDAVPNPAEGGIPQPDPGAEYYRGILADDCFAQATAYWKDMVGRVKLDLPDRRWSDAFAAITGHLAMCMNEGAPDVAVVNYNVFNRDGMYSANAFQKAGRADLAEKAIDYFLAHPFNGRIHPEADNPGQILWIMGQHYRFTKDRAWLQRVYPSLRKLVEMVAYYRGTPGPHYVAMEDIAFGDDVPREKRRELKPGSCDGHHPEYTEAYDIAGLREAAELARAMGREVDAQAWAAIADKLFAQYDAKFGANLPKGYGSYSVLWPCRLYPLHEGKAHEQFRTKGVQKPSGWRYFPLATAHQGLLAGNRDAAAGTINLHLDHPQMRGWFAFDEGGKSGAGGWRHVRTTWSGDVAMPHGWAIAELSLLIRDALVSEDDERLVLLAGIPTEWFGLPFAIANLPTHFGPITLRNDPDKATLTIDMPSPPAGGFVLRTPAGDRALPRETRSISLNADGR